MNKTVRLVVGLLLAGFAVSSPLRAEDLTGRVGVGGIALAGFPLGQKSVKDQAKDVGPIFGGLVQYGLNKHWGVGVSYENFDAGHGIRVEPIILQAIHRCMPESRLSPTLALGLGASRGVDVNKFNHFAAKVGLGLDYFVTPDVAVGPQVNYHYVSESDSSIRHLHGIGAGLAASYFFGKPSAAPVAAPAPVVKAPVDTDGDGVFDPSDRCPGTPKGVAVDGNGCPLDSDGDGVLDYQDKCPNTPQGALVDKDGCPQKPPEKVSIELKVLFDTAKAEIKPEFNDEIKKVADFMKSYPATQAEIEGHTDNVGSEASNVSLSQRRADAVKQYLAEKLGVDAARLSSKGYGPNNPVADNATAEGRSKNRRVVATLTAIKK